jgi:cysteine/histidine-rich domain-containing protein
MQGCVRSAHNNVKPVEPEKVEIDKTLTDEVIEYKAPQPLKPSLLERPPFDSPLVKLKYSVSASLQQELNKMSNKSEENSIPHISNMSNEVAVGTSCTNGGCKEVII